MQENLFLNECCGWDGKNTLYIPKPKFGRTVGFGESYLELQFWHFEVFRLHAIVQDAAEAVQLHSGKGPASVTCLGEDQNHVCLVTCLGYSFA